MTISREYAPSEFYGESVPLVSLKTTAARGTLVGKRIGYDLSYSASSLVGRVTGAGPRGYIEIDGEPAYLGSVTQLVVLHDQETNGRWKA